MNDVLLRVKSESDSERWGVGCIILDKNNKMLCIQRSDNKLWSSPGGTVDPGETIVDAVIREIKEETGLNIENPTYLGMNYTYTLKNEKTVVWNSYCFICETYSGDVKIQPDEVSDVKWLGLYECLSFNLFKPFLYSLDMMMQIPKYFNRLYDNVAKLTSMEQKLTIHNPGSNGANGHFDSTGNWVYDKPEKSSNDKTAPQHTTSSNNANSTQINNLKTSYINYYKNLKDFRKLYQVKNGEFIFPEYKTAIKDGIVKDKKSYFTLFKEQYVHFMLTHKK